MLNIYKKAKYDFEYKVARNAKNDPKSFYKYARSKTSVKETVGPILQSDVLITDDSSMCLLFNEYFSSVFTKEGTLGELPEVESRLDQDSIFSLDINQDIIRSKLKKLKPNKSPGVDQYPSNFLKELAEVICFPLETLFRNSLLSGEVPLCWKQSNISPIFKSGSRKQWCNYRPVSLTSHIGKIFEIIVKEKITAYLNEQNIIGPSQHGFRNKRSCLSNLLSFFNDVYNWVDQGEPVDVIYLDFKKAFDKVPHKRLLLKLHAYGIRGDIFRWVKNWLLNRKQRVVINGAATAWLDVVSGVPQGSVLGPLLFIIYINDLDSDLINKMLKFADDAKLYGRVSTMTQVDSIREDLKKLFDWSKKWGMTFNADKYKVMHFGYSNKDCNYEIDNQLLESVREEKDLGIIVSDSLKVSPQCIKAVKNANRVLGAIKRTIDNRSKDVIIDLYKALVRPHLEYAMCAWRPHYVKDIKLLEGVQRRATKLISELSGLSYNERLKKVNLTTLETRRVRGDLIEVYKIFHGLTDLNSNDFFILSKNELRGHQFKLFKPRVFSDIGKYSFVNRIVDKWNSLPVDVVSAGSLNIFKNKIDLCIRNVWGLI